MANTARDYVPNGTRKIRAGRPDGVGLPSKGNANSTGTNGRLHRDTKPAFPQIVFGEMKAYSVDPYENVGGVFFDRPKPVTGGPGSRAIPEAPKATRPTPAGPSTRRRKAPPAGTRPSLSSIRLKG